MDKAEIFSRLKKHLSEMFEVPGAKITPDARLGEDLELDSIDAIDLIVKLQEMTGKKIKAQDFRSVRTVQDVVDKVYALIEVRDA